MAKRTIAIACGATCATVCMIAAANYMNLQHAMSQVEQADARNRGIEVFVHYEYFINPSVLVYDLRTVSDNTNPMDVMRVLVQFAESQKDQTFSTVELSHRGTEKFVLKGKYFQSLGKEYGTQNPVYTLRTLPENVYKPDGTRAFGSWTGGLLGVLSKQMEDFSQFHRDWYIDDLMADVKRAGHAD